MRRQLVPGPVVRLTVIKAKTRPGIEATLLADQSNDVMQNAYLINLVYFDSDFLSLAFRLIHTHKKVTGWVKCTVIAK